MPSINLKHRASIHNAEATSFSLHRMHMESYADAISALLECFEDVSEECYQLRQELQEVCNAIGSTEYMDPPDGGSVTIAEQVIRMKEDRNQLRQELAANQAECKTKDEIIEKFRRAIGDHYAPDDCYATGPLTGNDFLDLIQCPACSAIAAYEKAQDVTGDDFLHMIDESNFAQERE